MALIFVLRTCTEQKLSQPCALKNGALRTKATGVCAHEKGTPCGVPSPYIRSQ